ncbi:MAG: hypothetical protein KJ896_05035, partial [Nanoarchaeota archaeon]|nr:hypothetical protein [Nanoarchaeota archaeon]
MARRKTKRLGIGTYLPLVLLVLVILFLGHILFEPALTGLIISSEEFIQYEQGMNLKVNSNQEIAWILQDHPSLFYLKSVRIDGNYKGDGRVKVYLETIGGQRYLIMDTDELSKNKNLITGNMVKENGSTELNITIPESFERESINDSLKNNASAEFNSTSLSINDTLNQSERSEETSEEETIESPKSDEENNETLSVIVREIEFNGLCLESCLLPSGLNSTEFALVFEIEESAELELTNIKYTLEDFTEKDIKKEFEFSPEIKNSKNELIEYDLEFENVDTGILENFETIRKPKSLGISSIQKLKIKEGRYNIAIKPKNHDIKSIVIHDVEIGSDVSEFISIDDVEESGEFADYVKVYAIDPTQFNFTNATVTVTATGTELYKCKDWDFAEQSCYGEWVLFKTGLTPGQDYTFTLTPDDPGFGEINISNAQHLDENYTYISDIYDQVNTKDDTWSEAINVKEFIRVTYETDLTNGNVIDVFVRNPEQSNTWFEVYNLNTTFPMLGSSGVVGSAEGEWKYITLENVAEPTDTFDFKIMGGSSLEFDYIHDAPANGTSCGDVNSDLTLTSNITTNGTCFIINASNIVIDGAGYTITGNGSGFGFDNLNNSGDGFDNITIKNFAGVNNFDNFIHARTMEDSLIINNS